jgi:biopolymer transport protein ExbD
MPKKLPEVNASSMADIAFLLLIFFLVTTSIETDTGLPVRLPAWVEDEVEPEEFNRRNVYSIIINSNDQLLVRGKQSSLAKLRENTKEFIINPSKRSDLAEAPNQAVVMLKNDRGTSYDMYLSVYNELKGAYRELWDEAANQLYGRNYSVLSKEARKEVRSRIPLVISEAEPVEFGQE